MDVNEAIREALLHKPSNIHITVGHPIILEIKGSLSRMTASPIDQNEFEQFARVIRGKEGATSILSQSSDYDGGFTIDDIAGNRRRLRVNMTALNSVRHPGAASFVMRPLDDMPPTLSQVGMPEELIPYCYPKDGAVYVVGPTSSGKTSTFAALFRYAAETGNAYHGVMRCYESPPEFALDDLSSEHLIIDQVAVNDAWGLKTFADAVRNAMRAHPCAIMIGEVRDLETVQAIVEAALTGHPVFGTVHATNPTVAFQRLITRYPAEIQSSGLYDLISTTQLIIAQRLVKCLDGNLAALREWLIFDPSVRSKLYRAGSPGAVAEQMAVFINNKDYGQSFAESARQLFEEGRIDEATALEYGAITRP